MTTKNNAAKTSTETCGKFLLSVLPVGQNFGFVGVAKHGNHREAHQTEPRTTREAAMEAIREWAEKHQG